MAVRGWEEEEAHSSTTLHYVRHFPEDSLGSENREDVGERWGKVRRGGGVRGCAGRPNKYLAKSSGKLIPSLGRLLLRRDGKRGGGPTFKRRRRARTSERVNAVSMSFHSRDFSRAILRADRRTRWNHALT